MSEDTISRKAAIAEIARWIGYIDEDMIGRIQIGLKKLSSSQPDLSGYSDRLWKAAYERGKTEAQAEIVRCKDCKHKYVDGNNVRFNVCELNHNKVQSDDWYCADAERRTDDCV